MNLQELTRLVSLGEGPHLEFKRRVPRSERIVKEIVAFANTQGGRLLLGVDDDGTILGVRDAAEEEFALKQALDEHCDPMVPHRSQRIAITKKRDVILLHVPESADKPHAVVNPDGTRAVYQRIGENSVEASREARRLMRYENDSHGVLIEFGEKEQILLRYLDNYGRITVGQFANLANIPRRRASQTLVLLARANVLLLHPDQRQDYFTLALRNVG